jgi:hypothetical protein
VEYFSGIASCQDTNLNLNEKTFESEFHKVYPSSKDEAKAAAALAAAEKQVAKTFAKSKGKGFKNK